MRGRVRAMRVSGEYEYGNRTMIETKDHVFDSRAKCDRKGQYRVYESQYKVRALISRGFKKHGMYSLRCSPEAPELLILSDPRLNENKPITTDQADGAANVVANQCCTASNFAAPLSPVNPPSTRTKCERERAAMRATTVETRYVAVEGASSASRT